MREDFVLFSYKYRTDVQSLQQFCDVFIKYFYSFMMKCNISAVKSGTKEKTPKLRKYAREEKLLHFCLLHQKYAHSIN